jgi:hypothetical protein
MNWYLSKVRNLIVGGCRYLILQASRKMKDITWFLAAMKITRLPIQARCPIYGGGLIRNLFKL